MIDVLKRLAELDEKNPNVVNPQSQKTKQKQQVKESAPVAECGPMGMMGGMDKPSTPASFSINASAADGQEVSQMLRDIMNLAGVHKDAGADSMPMDKEPVTGADDHVPDDKELMRAMLDTMNEPDDGAVIPAAPPMPGTNLPPAGMGDGGGMDLDAEMGPEEPMGLDGGEEVPDDVGDMADHVRDMADELADKDKEDLGLESYDNTPADPTEIPKFDANKMAYNPNAGGVNKGLTNQPTATLEDQLYNEYKKFVSEAKAKCCCEEKGKKECPVHNKAMKEEKEKTMSRAAKGVMKYGKKGMKALADAGKKGKDLEPVRAKYNKYD